MTLKTTRVGLATALSVIALGCGASDETPAGGGPAGGGSSGVGGAGSVIPPVLTPEVCAAQRVPGRTPLRRLTATEFNNTVKDLIDDVTYPADKFPPPEESLGFLNNADAFQTTELHVGAYFTAAETMAAEYRKRGGLTLPCAADAQNCATQFIVDFGGRAFRRPLSDAEVASYLSRFNAGLTGGSFEEGLEWVVGRLLQSPNFLYRIELDGEGSSPGQAVQLSGHSVATRLSYFLWQTMPDAELFGAAAGNQLATVEGVAAQTDRMIASSKFDATLSSFHSQWIGYDKVLGAPKTAVTTPVWSVDLQRDMVRETELFVKSIFASKGSMLDMFTATHSFVSPALAEFYGIQHPGGTDFARVENVPHRFGLLTSPSILAAQAHQDQSAPVKRGELIRKHLLCTEPLPPPPGLKIVIPPVMPGSTTRERFEQHRTDPTCKGCHFLLDPLGVPLENYDELGRWRDSDGGKPVDANGELTGVSSLSDPPGAALVNGAAELAQKLAASPEAQQCMVSNWFRYSMGHAEEDADACTLGALETRFDGSKQNLHDLLVGIATSDGFRYRVDFAQ